VAQETPEITGTESLCRAHDMSMSDNAMVAVLLPRRRSKLASGAKDMEHAMSQTQTPRSR